MIIDNINRFWTPSAFLRDTFSLWVASGIAAILAAGALTIAAMGQLGRLTPLARAEIWARWRSWVVIAPLMMLPIILGSGPLIAAVLVLGILCYREFARATGLHRHTIISLVVVGGMVALTMASVDHWEGFFRAATILTALLLMALPLIEDHPKGYLQRTSLGLLGFTLFGAGLAHMGFMANAANYRPLALIIVVAVELNDIFAYICGKTFGHRKLCPNTSPNKTIAGALGALILTTSLTAILHHLAYGLPPFSSNALHTAPFWPTWWCGILLGLIISIGGQCGDLVISSIKRDVGIKDMGALFPGHGGLLDRFDSLVLVIPGVYHFAAYFGGLTPDSATRIFVFAT